MKIGIIGAGQLSRMLAIAGIPMGFEFVFFNTAKESCVDNLGKVYHSTFNDVKTIRQFADECDIITYENENIPYDFIKSLELLKPVYPNAEVLKSTQDRLLEKKLFKTLAIPTVPYQAIEDRNDLQLFVNQYDFPVIIKSRQQGYDGKGQYKIGSKSEIDKVANLTLSNSIVEKMISFDREVSIIAVRSVLGEIQYYDLAENTHVNGVLNRTVNRKDDPMFELAKSYIDKIVNHFNYIGCIALEFFQVKDELLANEIAPRVHNSGHWTIEGAFCSQFQNHLRAISGCALGNTNSSGFYSMTNMLGKLLPRHEILKSPNHYFHDYHKYPTPGRKVGHICEKI